MEDNLIQNAYYSLAKIDYDKHNHNYHEIIFIKKGTIELTCENESYLASEGNIIVISNMEYHSVHVVSNEYERYCIQIAPAFVRNALRNNLLCSILTNRPHGFNHVIDTKFRTADYLKIFELMVFENNHQEEFSFEIQKALLLLLLVKIYRLDSSYFPVIINEKSGIIANIQKEFERDSSKNYSLDELAKKYHVSKSYLSHAFKEITGYGVIQYLSEQRLAIAKNLLCTTNMKICDIAFEVGFSGAGNFSRFLKDDTGLNPHEFREKYGEDNLE